MGHKHKQHIITENNLGINDQSIKIKMLIYFSYKSSKC